MARKARRHSNTGIYHVMLRGINRQDLFHEESDYLFFLERLRLLAHPKNEKNEPASPLCDIYAYCLMTNHVHVMLATKEKLMLSSLWQYLMPVTTTPSIPDAGIFFKTGSKASLWMISIMWSHFSDTFTKIL